VHEYYEEIKETRLRLGIVLSALTEVIIYVELTFPTKSKVDVWHQVKMARYEGLKNELKAQGFKVSACH